MIYTVTFNPSLDYIVKVDNFKTGQVNRTASERLFPGGKGINVSIGLKDVYKRQEYDPGRDCEVDGYLEAFGQQSAEQGSQGGNC